MMWKVKVTQLCPTLCDPTDFTVHGILQARILEWVAFPFFTGSSQPRDQTQVSHIASRFFTSLSHKGSPRILEWVAYPFSRGSSQPRSWTGVSCIAGGFFTNWVMQLNYILTLLNLALSFGRQDQWRRQWHPTPVLLPGKSHGWRSLVGLWCMGHII